ncbi:N-acetylglucosaminyldiphosphoundecaprenol N-acetyl-beta-D-mannosaminyltransferase [Methylorubrum aminovorans]|uniref:N-acetylglucosaminyldiphosphoundecaprenol N-acetyl-beta-D-mannosaminyltransferase n=1 Tax=Methylorubrum aminovorans TaxID=269069 RepID=A0ABQ4U9Y9_9HYPH|nr:WecB/TagA/CpsF family glycosyltransferase [Methylorubrum aminovorans]GJE64123.1 N-acetylglucosaminyldiphosphoundecaprenol N-acetyl-beta-D-mannosaminyltransferase [Methylorubrum aminovorans]
MPVGLVSPLSLRERFLKAPFDSLEPAEVLALLSRAPAGLDPAPFRYVVTPNVDHVVRLSADPSLAPLYEGAWLSLCDSKPIAALSRLLIPGGLPHLPGSTLTEILFRTVIAPSDRIALVVAHPSLAAQMRAAFPEVAFDILAAPPDIDGDPAAFAACAAFVAGSTARFTFIAVGAPRSERIAFQASLDPAARGTALCVGASLEFLVGRKRRAPLWMQRAGIEWLHRLAGEPRRLWRRYLFGVAPLARLALAEAAARLAARRALPRPTEH